MKKKNKVYNIPPEELHAYLKEHIVEDTKENAKKYQKKGIYMGRVGAKKFYVYYKRPNSKATRFNNRMRGDICRIEDENKSRIRYTFSKMSGKKSQHRLLGFIKEAEK